MKLKKTHPQKEGTNRPGSFITRLSGYIHSLTPKTIHAPIRQGFPDLVRTPSDLPASLRLLAGQMLSPQTEIKLIFFIPPQTFPGSWSVPRYVPEQALLFTTQGVLHVQAQTAPEQPPSTTYFQAGGLLYARLSLLLLYGKLELAGVADDKPAQVTVEFNTVGEHLLRPGLRQLLQLAWGQTKLEAPPKPHQMATMARLSKLPMKFENGLRYRGIQPGEQLLGFVFQPALWLRRWNIWRRQISATSLLALTNRQVIMLQEEIGRITHGWIFTFCPLESIANIKLEAGEVWPKLLIRLKRGNAAGKYLITLTPEAAQDWANLWQQYNPADFGL